MPWVAPVAAIASTAITAAAASQGSNTSVSSIKPLSPSGSLEQLLYGGGDGTYTLKPGMEWLATSVGPQVYSEKFQQNNPQYFQYTPSKGGALEGQYDDLAKLYSSGPSGSDVTAGYDSQRSLAEMLGQMSQNGGMPTQGDLNNANDFFAPRQKQLESSFQDQTIQSNQLAARLGRSVDDPILQAKLRTGFLRQQDDLNAQKQDFAFKLPQQKLSYAADRSNILSNLASQAFSNRTAILSLGSQLGQQERGFRLNAAGSQVNYSSGGGALAGLTGGIAGLAGGLKLGQGLGNLFGTDKGGNTTNYANNVQDQQDWGANPFGTGGN